MKTTDHYKRSLFYVKLDYPELYATKKKIVEEMLLKLHEWLDEYSDTKGEDLEGAYDFTGHLAIRHRAKRHHLEGINQAVEKFSSMFGQDFSDMIRREALRHIIDDMVILLFADDYKRIGFWKN